MKVTGISFIRNAIRYDYPIVEAIRSILPLCDEVVVAVGASDDDTLALVQGIDPQKIKILPTIWDDSLREGGRVLAEETNKALQAVSADSDWVFYIQGDEVLHEQYIPAVRKAMQDSLHQSEVDGLLFHYKHFYGSYDYVGSSYGWYRREIRVVRPGRDIYSYKDAQGFRKGSNRKLSVKLIDAYIYHYGWVKSPESMKLKEKNFHKYWHDDQWIAQNVAPGEAFDYSGIDALERFQGSHPAVMQERIDRINWAFSHDMSYNRASFKDKIKKFVEKLTGGYIIGEYRNYKLLK